MLQKYTEGGEWRACDDGVIADRWLRLCDADHLMQEISFAARGPHRRREDQLQGGHSQTQVSQGESTPPVRPLPGLP
jgi:hypothetical protein